MKKKNNNNVLWIIIIIVFIAILVSTILVINKQSITANVNNQDSQFIINNLQEIRSETMNLTITIPHGYLVEEKVNAIVMKNDLGEIRLTRQGTNYKNIDEYLVNLAEKNNFTITDKKHITLNHEEGIECFINNTKKSYFFYSDKGWVYTLSTESLELYDEIFQIAQTFRYQ